VALGLGDRFEQVEARYAKADRLLGRLIKATPSKLRGELGTPAFGWHRRHRRHYRSHENGGRHHRTTPRHRR
jgi:pyruvate carboxylase